jgi:hypothetical protein
MSASRELVGLPLYDAALALIDLAARTTVHEINTLNDKALALAISASIYQNIDPEVQLMDLRARVLENRPKLAAEWYEQQQNPSLDDALRRVGAAAFLENVGAGDFISLDADALVAFGARNHIPDNVLDVAVAELRRRRGHAQRLLAEVEI